MKTFSQFDLKTKEGQQGAEALIRDTFTQAINKLDGMPKVIARVYGRAGSAFAEIGVAESDEKPTHFLFGSNVELRRDLDLYNGKTYEHNMSYGSAGSFDPENATSTYATAKLRIGSALISNWAVVKQLLINLESMWVELKAEFERQSQNS